MSVPETSDRTRAPAELGDVLFQRVVVLGAALDLHRALAEPLDAHPEVFDEPGVIRIDLRETDSRYEEDYHYIVEAGGAGRDVTVVPKGVLGAQIDLPPSP